MVKDIIDSARASASSWQDFQGVLQDELNITIKERGRGAVFADLGTRGKNQPHAKLSCLGREYSRARLEADFGELERLNEGRKSPPKKGYDSKPLHRDPERGRLYQEYQVGIKKRYLVNAAKAEQLRHEELLNKKVHRRANKDQRENPIRQLE